MMLRRISPLVVASVLCFALSAQAAEKKKSAAPPTPAPAAPATTTAQPAPAAKPAAPPAPDADLISAVATVHEATATPARTPFEVSVSVGGGVNSEDETNSSAAHIRAGVAASWEVAQNFRLAFSFASSFYSATYDSPGSTSEPSPLTQSTVSEQRYDFGLGANYRFALANDHLELEPGLSVRADAFHNKLFPMNVGGIAPELLVRWKLAPTFAIEANGGYTYNLFFTAATSNPLGKPVGLGTWGLGGRFYLAEGKQSVRLGYVGDALTLDHTYRLFHTVEASYSVAF